MESVLVFWCSRVLDQIRVELKIQLQHSNTPIRFHLCLFKKEIYF